MTSFRVEQLWIYPVKSLGGVSVAEAEITAAGSLAGDREWIVTRPDGSALWQGDIPCMTLLAAYIEGGELVLRGHDGSVGPRAHDMPGPPVAVLQEGHLLQGRDQGDAVAGWLTAQLGSPCRLVRVGERAHDWGGLSPIHVVSANSLAALNARLVARGDHAVAVERFRPNVVLAGSHAPFAEEHAPDLQFADASLTLNEPCIRCELPNIDLKTARRGKQPLKLIGAMSRERSGALPASFGTYCVAHGRGLRVGMSTAT